MRHADANFSTDEYAANDHLLHLSRVLVQMTQKMGKHSCVIELVVNLPAKKNLIGV